MAILTFSQTLISFAYLLELPYEKFLLGYAYEGDSDCEVHRAYARLPG